MNNDILSAFLHGIVLAPGLIVPLGVQNIFIFNQGAKQPKFSKALPSIIAASICDTMLICMAVLGISLLILEISWLKLSIFIVGFIFLIYMGYNTWNQPPIDLTMNSGAFSA
ncbi:MAG: LysE/ArgO family amino acid transporter, partial [Rickettsia aeschlimannii]